MLYSCCAFDLRKYFYSRNSSVFLATLTESLQASSGCSTQLNTAPVKISWHRFICSADTGKNYKKKKIKGKTHLPHFPIFVYFDNMTVTTLWISTNTDPNAALITGLLLVSLCSSRDIRYKKHNSVNTDELKIFLKTTENWYFWGRT